MIYRKIRSTIFLIIALSSTISFGSNKPKIISKSRYGVVYKQKHNGEMVAIKKSHLTYEKRHYLLREAKILKAIAPQAEENHLQKYITHKVHQNTLLLCTKYINGIELYYLIKNNGPLKTNESRHIFIQVLTAINHLHENGIVHWDISPDNIRVNDKKNATLCDFDLSNFNPAPHSKEIVNYTPGKPGYIAPELMEKTFAIPSKTDIYSLGIVLYIMLTGCPPYEKYNDENFHEIYKKNELRHRLEQKNISPDCIDLLTKLICEPGKRLNYQQIMEHPWIKAHIQTQTTH